MEILKNCACTCLSTIADSNAMPFQGLTRWEIPNFGTLLAWIYLKHFTRKTDREDPANTRSYVPLSENCKEGRKA